MQDTETEGPPVSFKGRSSSTWEGRHLTSKWQGLTEGSLFSNFSGHTAAGRLSLCRPFCQKAQFPSPPSEACQAFVSGLGHPDLHLWVREKGASNSRSACCWMPGLLLLKTKALEQKLLEGPESSSTTKKCSTELWRPSPFDCSGSSSLKSDHAV